MEWAKESGLGLCLFLYFYLWSGYIVKDGWMGGMDN